MKQLQLLKAYIKESIFASLQSHTDEPIVGDMVKNINPGCKHFKSKGKVINVKDLKVDAGKIVVYQVFNSGDSFSPGDVLEKTLDQLTLDNE